jgi:hypothetical protein
VEEIAMTPTQASLFGDVSQPQREAELVLISRPGRPLTKAQRAFNRLVAKIEKLRANLRQEAQRLDNALTYYGQHLHPRLLRLTALRKEFVRALAPFLGHGQLKKGKRKTLRMILAEQLDGIVKQEGTLTDDDLKALFVQIHGVDFEQAEREGIEQMRSAMEDMLDDFGIDIDFSGFQAGMSEEELAARTAEMAQRMQQEAEEEERASQRQDRPKTKRQIEKEERLRQVEEAREKSIATIYKQLAKVLHPDLEPDPERRQHKGALMQELTAAYRNNDLHTLLRLELEWIEREKGDLQRLTDEKLAIYNQVLREQAEDLEAELEALPYHPRYQPIVVPDSAFDIRVRTRGPAETHLLDQAIASLEGSTARLRDSHALVEVCDVIQAYRAIN